MYNGLFVKVISEFNDLKAKEKEKYRFMIIEESNRKNW